ncbi:MAG TPA: septum site-determining protein MinC [Methylocella sp.]|nr:septum site-determining protein MinC [Methylocella sp.]
MTIQSSPRHSIRFHGRSYHAMVLAPEAPLADWLAELDSWLSRSPGFFLGRPVVLDVSILAPGKTGLVDLLEKLTERNIKVMGIEGAEPSWLEFAMPPLLLSGRQENGIQAGGGPTASPAAGEETPAAAPSGEASEDAKAAADAVAAVASPPVEPAPALQPQRPNSLLLDSPVRSGQCIVHSEGDVIVVGSVASGAEVIAGGSIHIYGTLRGRAIAGSRDPRARIFCRKLEAELLSIDGLYMVAEDMPVELRGRPIQVWLDGDSLVMAQD